jgi:hypothetical protein
MKVNRSLRIILGAAMAATLMVLFLRLVVVKKLVPDDDLRLLYSNHKDGVERLKSMCLEDRKKSSMTYFTVSARAKEVDCVRLVGSKERCQEYARLFAVTKVGQVHWEDDCVWLYVDGWGFNGGKRKGLMWRATPMPQQDTRSRQRYVSIENGWYIYEVFVDLPLFVSVHK